MVMHKPPHPGGIVRRQCLEALDLSVTEAAKGLPSGLRLDIESGAKHGGGVAGVVGIRLA